MLRPFASTPEQKIHYTLRIASAMCFIGHGSFGIITKAIWCNYFAVFGIGHDLAYTLMPVMGTVDVLLGIVLLAYPMRFIPAWLVFWGIVTALLRPISGEPLAEFIERAGNYTAPLALLLLGGMGGKTIKSWLLPLRPDTRADELTWKRLGWCLRIAAFLLLAGHGWLNLIEKKGLLDQYAALGFSNPIHVARATGFFEIMAAMSMLIRPFGPLLICLILWKMASELFYPHYELFEWVERGGSYGCLLALWFVVHRRQTSANIHSSLGSTGRSTQILQ